MLTEKCMSVCFDQKFYKSALICICHLAFVFTPERTFRSKFPCVHMAEESNLNVLLRADTAKNPLTCETCNKKNPSKNLTY